MVEHCRRSLLTDPRSNLGDSSAEGLDEETSGDNISPWAGGHSCDLLGKNVTVFCPYPKNLPKANSYFYFYFFFKKIHIFIFKKI